MDLANGLPRVALILAGSLLQRHGQQPNPPKLIQLKTWEQVKAEWQVRRLDFLGTDSTSSTRRQLDLFKAKELTRGHNPVLCVKENGLVFLGEYDITREINHKDHEVLGCLYKHRDEVCAKETLTKEAWSGEESEGVSDQAIAAAMARLRGVLRKHSPSIEYIETVKGCGYRLHFGGFRVDKRGA